MPLDTDPAQPDALSRWSSTWRYLLAAFVGLVHVGDHRRRVRQPRGRAARSVVGALIGLDLLLGVMSVCLLALRRRYPLAVACLTLAATTVSSASVGRGDDRPDLDGHLATPTLGDRRRGGDARDGSRLGGVLPDRAARSVRAPAMRSSSARSSRITYFAATIAIGYYIGTRRELLASLRRAGGDGGPRAGAGDRAGPGRGADADRAGDARRARAPDLAGRAARRRAGLPGRPHARGDPRDGADHPVERAAGPERAPAGARGAAGRRGRRRHRAPAADARRAPRAARRRPGGGLGGRPRHQRARRGAPTADPVPHVVPDRPGGPDQCPQARTRRVRERPAGRRPRDAAGDRGAQLGRRRRRTSTRAASGWRV